MTNQRSILIIEDEPAVAHSIRDGLEQHGFRCRWAANSASGLDLVQSRQIDLILLDVRLPDGSGFDLCQQLRRSGVRQPIIFLTVQREEVDKVLGLEMGADDYVTKPFSLRELVSRVRAQLRRAYGELATIEEQQTFLGELLIDHGRAQVKRDSQDLALTPIEYRLLTFLAQNLGQAVSRTQIVEAVWGHDADVDDAHVVNVNVRRLRKKIEPDPSKPTLLLTVPGIGYRLVEP